MDGPFGRERFPLGASHSRMRKTQTLGEMAHHPDDEAGPRYEIHRDDLLEVLSGAIGGDVELLFNCSIVAIEERPEGVSATFSDGSRHEFALILAAMETAPIRAG